MNNKFKAVPFTAKINRGDTAQKVAEQIQLLIDEYSQDGWTYLRIFVNQQLNLLKLVLLLIKVVLDLELNQDLLHLLRLQFSRKTFSEVLINTFNKIILDINSPKKTQKVFVCCIML